MASFDYKRANRRRVCRVCRKSDWCSYTPDEKISFCARVIENADRVSRTGWGVFYHEKPLFPFESLPFPRQPPHPKKPELAPLEIRDFAYRKLIELAPALLSKEITEGPKGLRARKILDFENYGALPKTSRERATLAKKVRNSINGQFPDYVRKQKFGVSGLPGFWIDEGGKIQLWRDRDYSCPMMLIPYRDARGFIQACQIRFMCSSPANGLRYVWLSTPDKTNGLTCGTPLHYASRSIASSGKPVLITEGALKAETAQIFRGDFVVIANGGVSCSHEEIVAVSRFRPLLIAFDSDYRQNSQVARHLAGFLKTRFADAERHKYDAQTSFLIWSEKFKGIDDALLNKIPISLKTPVEWFNSLDYPVRQKINNLTF